MGPFLQAEGSFDLENRVRAAAQSGPARTDPCGNTTMTETDLVPEPQPTLDPADAVRRQPVADQQDAHASTMPRGARDSSVGAAVTPGAPGAADMAAIYR